MYIIYICIHIYIIYIYRERDMYIDRYIIDILEHKNQHRAIFENRVFLLKQPSSSVCCCNLL